MRYPLQETPSDDYAQRTAWNVRDSDGTLILVSEAPVGGTALTVREARRHRKPLLQEAPKKDVIGEIRQWIDTHTIETLNVAGPRESEAPGIYQDAKTLVMHLLADEA